ncbi:Aste57867_10450 [Aphanomyces stellatus]|uniref:Aste57867_10450 protein n=1 Tax=Aphanomyces stellatus TaxID=120398 RepID=A0A485KQD7_9STRA|nr:hypothetical protein As57867_010410 [Aphanomyces stellatus]VFT87324.1 Aste57867_10450 [Aphanomyces stellatus]
MKRTVEAVSRTLELDLEPILRRFIATRTHAPREELMHTPVVFYIRPLLWEELRKSANQAEIHELHQVLGHQYIAENEALQAELQAFVDILGDYQKENDRIREAILNRPTLPEPPGRALLLDQLKLLASDLHDRQLTSAHDRELLGYVLSTQDSQQQNNGGMMTPRLKDYVASDNAVFIRPGTAEGHRRRPSTASHRPPSSRGLSSRGSVSSTASAPAVLEDLVRGNCRSRSFDMLQGCVGIRQIDSVKQQLREALRDEKQQLLDDIEFIQGCLEMEQDLIEADTKQVAAVAPAPPSLKDLHDFRKTLEQACLDKDKHDQVQERIARTDEMLLRRKSIDPVEAMMGSRRPSLTPTPPPPKRTSTKAHKVREIVQTVRDEPFFT